MIKVNKVFKKCLVFYLLKTYIQGKSVSTNLLNFQLRTISVPVCIFFKNNISY